MVASTLVVPRRDQPSQDTPEGKRILHYQQLALELLHRHEYVAPPSNNIHVQSLTPSPVTPVLIDSIGWGTYLLFAALNASFLPIIYFFYPETAGRSLEEIDLIFAKGYLENKSYVLAAKELPHMDPTEIERYNREFDMVSSDEEARSSDGSFKEKKRQDEELMPQTNTQA